MTSDKAKPCRLQSESQCLAREPICFQLSSSSAESYVNATASTSASVPEMNSSEAMKKTTGLSLVDIVSCFAVVQVRFNRFAILEFLPSLPGWPNLLVSKETGPSYA